ncbi:hypothetical protein [Thermococcus sp.]|uniref:hypothetical protein n=1 Tax=Thermococcus sp. TaxID=35749 RepID=UPI0026381067|nr:hypothetical protein [Thermococcus sp.]
MKYKFLIVLIEGEWMDEDDAIEEYGMSYVDMIEDSFEVEVEAKNWKDAEEKIALAAKVLKEGPIPAPASSSSERREGRS